MVAVFLSKLYIGARYATVRRAVKKEKDMDRQTLGLTPMCFFYELTFCTINCPLTKARKNSFDMQFC
jgi:hypothetical protein